MYMYHTSFIHLFTKLISHFGCMNDAVSVDFFNVLVSFPFDSLNTLKHDIIMTEKDESTVIIIRGQTVIDILPHERTS